MSCSQNYKFQWGPKATDISTFSTTRKGYLLDVSAQGLTHTATVSTAAEAAVLSKLYQKIRDENFGFNSLNFLGELRETVKMIRRPFSALRDNTTKFVKTLKSTRQDVRKTLKLRKSETEQQLRVRRANAVKNAVAGSWLEYAFGVQPLVSDTKGLLDETITLLGGGPIPRSKIQVRTPDIPGFATEVQSVNTASFNDACRQTLLRHTSTVASAIYRCGLKSDLNGPVDQIELARRRLNFDIRGFVPTMWELMPYSFLIDYFANVGPIIEAVFTDTRNVTWVNKTLRQESFTTLQEYVSPIYRSGQSTWSTLGAFGGNPTSFRRLRYVTYTRTALASLPLPPLVISTPPGESTKWFNVVALIAQARDFKP